MPTEEYTSGNIQLDEAEVEFDKPPLFTVVFFQRRLYANGICCLCNTTFFWI
jgi:hypothetical protein